MTFKFTMHGLTNDTLKSIHQIFRTCIFKFTIHTILYFWFWTAKEIQIHQIGLKQYHYINFQHVFFENKEVKDYSFWSFTSFIFVQTKHCTLGLILLPSKLPIIIIEILTISYPNKDKISTFNDVIQSG